MKLYKGGYGQYQYYTVAEDTAGAIKNIQETYNMQALPVTAEEIDGIDGYNIVPMKDKEIIRNIECPEGAKIDFNKLSRREILAIAKSLEIDGKIATMSNDDLIEKIKEATA